MPSSARNIQSATALVALLLLVCLTAPARASIIAEQEPNDTCPGQSISCGDTVDPARIDPPGDVDWYTFNTTVGEQITIETDAGSDCAGVWDTTIYLYASNCSSILAMDDDSGNGFYSKISGFIAPYTGTYSIKVTAYNDVESGCYRLFLGCDLPASLDESALSPLEAAVAPNPTTGPCQISFRVPGAGPLAVRIVDVQGRDVWRAEGWAGAAQARSFTWDGRGTDGRLMPTGIYLARVTCGNRTAIRRIVIAR